MIGICTLSIVPIRKSPTDQSEQVSQLLYGEQVIIEDQLKNWYFIKCIHDDYQGFVDKKQLKVFTKIEQLDYIVNAPSLAVDLRIITMGSFIKKSDFDETKISDWLSANLIQPINTNSDSIQLMLNASNLLNAPYLWGGKTVFGIDCSGFTQIIFRLSGINIKRDAYQQAEMGINVSSLKESKTGDLAFFNKGKGDKITHVGIVIQEENALKIIHASGWVQINKLTEEGIFDDDGVLSHHYLFTKRILV